MLSFRGVRAYSIGVVPSNRPGDGMVDIQDLKSWDREVVRVQVSPWAPQNLVIPIGTYKRLATGSREQVSGLFD